MLLLLCAQTQPVFREGKSSLEQIIRREKDRGCLHLLLFVRDAKLTLSMPGPMRAPRPAGKDRALGRLGSVRSQHDAHARQSNCGQRLLVHLSPFTSRHTEDLRGKDATIRGPLVHPGRAGGQTPCDEEWEVCGCYSKKS